MSDNLQNTEARVSSDKRQRRNCGFRTASLVSDMFSPLLTATYGMIVALWLTPMSRLPLEVRAWASLGVFFITAVIPGMTLYMLIRAGKVSDASVSDRRERRIPFMVAVACYVGAALYLGVLHAPRWLVCFLVAAAAVALLELIVSFRWKISAHAGASGGLAGFVFWLGMKEALAGDPFIMISVAFMLVGVIGWARLFLHRHTICQVFAGAVLGFFVELAMLSFF